jgi:hypothetical protein
VTFLSCADKHDVLPTPTFADADARRMRQRASTAVRFSTGDAWIAKLPKSYDIVAA